MVEEPVSKPAGSQAGLGRLASGSQKSPVPAARPSLLSEIDIEEQDRISTGFGELDRVLGDGIVAGSLVLVGGDPGIGKIHPSSSGMPESGGRRPAGPVHIRGGTP